MRRSLRHMAILNHHPRSAAGGDNAVGSPPRGPVVVAGAGSGPSAFLLERAGGGEFARDRENKVRQGSPVPLPKGMTGELMRQVAALDVTRMSCDQITEWFASEDSTGKKMQHRVQGVTGKDLIRALHEAPEDMAAWLDPAESGHIKAIQEGMKDERFKSLREGLVRTLAERSGKLPEVEALKVARKINHHKQVWSATWKLVARGCCQGVLELRCLVRTLLYRLRINGPSVSLDDLSVFADYVRFILVPSRVYEVIGTAVAKALSGSLELILKSKSNKAAAGAVSESGATERCLQSFVGVLCALCPCPVGDSRDTTSTSEAGRRLGDVCIVALPVLCPGLRRFQEMNTRCVMASFLSNLSWHDDNKIQMYQASEETIPRVLLMWLCDGEMKELAKGNKYFASSRLHMATVIWNLSKRADNASGLVQPETFDMLFTLLCQDDEEGDVLRRIVSCIQNLASMRRCASDLTDYIASDPSVSNVLGTLFGLLARGGAKNMHQRVMGTFANLAYLCVSADASMDWVKHLRESLKQFLLYFAETADVLGNFSLDPLEARDRQLKFQGVRFEIARFLWCMIRLDICHGTSVDRLAGYIGELDILGASAGVLYENVPRTCLKHHEVVDLLQCVATPDDRPSDDASRGSKGHVYPAHGGSARSGSGDAAIEPSERTKVGTVRTFALWILAHYTGRPDDRVHVASHGGLKVLTSVLMGPAGLVASARACAGAERPIPSQTFINLKLAAKALANLCQAPQNAELVEPAGALAAIEALYAFMSDVSNTTSSSSIHSSSSVLCRAQQNCTPARYKIDPDYRKTYLVIQENLWRPVVKDPVKHDDGTVTVHYEVPAGNNECFELSKRITPLDVERKELQICRGEVPHQINVLAEVAACLRALAMHSSVLKLFAPAGVLGPFLQLSLDQLIPRETCLTALLDTPVKAYSQRAQVMSRMWSLITSTVLDSEGEIPGDDDDGDDVGDATVVGDGDCLAAVVGDPGILSTSGKEDRETHEARGVNREAVVDGADAPESVEERGKQALTVSFERGLETPRGQEQQQRRQQQHQEQNADVALWSRRMVQRKAEQALAVRVLDRLVAAADEDAFESGNIAVDGDHHNHRTQNTNARQPGGQHLDAFGEGPNLSLAGHVKTNRRRSSSANSMLDLGRRKSDELRRQSLLMTSGRAYTISGILSHQVLLSGVIILASPSGESSRKWRRRLPPTLAAPIESAQRRLEYFCIGLAGSVSNAVRRNWLALDGDRTNVLNAMKALYDLCVEHLSALVSRAECARFQNYAEPDVWVTAGATAAADRDTAGRLSFPPHDDPQGDPGNEKGSPPRGGFNPSVDSKAEFQPNRNKDDFGADGGRDDLAKHDDGEDAGERSDPDRNPRLQRQSSSMDSRRTTSGTSSVGGECYSEIGAFLMPEEEQVVQMLFRAILSLLSIPEGIAAEDMADATKKSNSSWRGGDPGVSMRSMRSDENISANRWGSFRGRGPNLQTGQRADNKAAGITRPVRGTRGRLDEILWLCYRLLRCTPGDGVLHVSLLVVSKITSIASWRRTNLSVLEGFIPTVASFLERPTLWIKHACITLLHLMASKNDIGVVLALAKGSTSRQVVACLGSTESGIRLAAANLLGILAKDSFYSKSIVFPEAVAQATSAGTGGKATSKAGSRRSFSRQSSGEWGSEASAEMDGDFDVNQRSVDGCIPPLLAMARLSGSDADRDGASMEQEAALCILEDLASSNNLCREAIVIHSGVPVLMQAAEGCSGRARRAIAGLLAELSISPGQRDTLTQAGGLLLLLQFQRSKDPQERIQADLALKNFGSDALSIHLAIARSSMEVIHRLFFRRGASNTVGKGLLRPIHDRQLREAAEGLAVCAMHKTSAANILSERGLPMILDMLRVRDFDVQYACTRALLHLIRHNGEHFSESMSEGDRRATILQLTCLVRPVRERAARLLQAKLKQFRERQIRGAAYMQERDQSSFQIQQVHQPLKTLYEQHGQQQQDQHGHTGNGLDVEADSSTTTTGFNPWHTRKEGCVALALQGDMAEMARLASQCLELLASQSVTAVDIILTYDVIESLTAQLHTYDTHNLGLDQTLAEGGNSDEGTGRGTSANTGDGILASALTNKRKNTATKLQRQCIAALSGLALNSTGATVRPASREAVERSLLFLAAFHWSKSVQGEASLALRRLQSKRNVPHPTVWGVRDCLKWLSCVDLDGMCRAAKAFLDDGFVGDPFRRPGFRSPWVGCAGGVDSRPSHPPRSQSRSPLGIQGSGASSSSVTQSNIGEHKLKDDSGGLTTAKHNSRLPENTQPQQPATYQEAGSPVTSTAPKITRTLAAVEGGRKRKSGRSSMDAEWARNVLEREAGTAGARLLQVTKSDLSRAPFHAPPEVSRNFLRSLRTLRLHAFATAVMKQCGAAWKQNDNASDMKREGGDHHGCATGIGVSQWQERRHTLKTINALLLRSKGNTEGIVVTDTNHSSSVVGSDTVEATDRFGSVLTLRLVRRSINNEGASEATSGRPENESRAWDSALDETKTRARKPMAVTLSDDFAAGTRLSDQGQPPLESGRSALPSSGTATPGRRASRFSRGRRVSYGRQSSGTHPERAEPAPAFTAWDATEALPIVSDGPATAGEKRCSSGLKYIGRLTDGLGEGIVEIYLGSFHQQALISEAKRVLAQPQNKGLGMELVAGVAAMGMGRNSIGATITTSRPYKKVTLEMSSSVTERECPDPEGYISTTLAVIEDRTGVSNLFVLDLSDTFNTQDPRDGRTSLMTAVLDNDEILVGRLLAEGVDIAVTDTQNRTALLHSIISKHDTITHLLLAHHSELVRSRLGGGSKRPGGDGRGRNRSGVSRGAVEPSAARGGVRGAAGTVSDMQGMLDKRDFTGKAALHHAVADVEERHEVVQKLLAAKAEVNIRDARGNSPLHIACQHGHIHIVKTLIIYSANAGARNEDLMTPLHIASLNLHIKIVSVLLKENQGPMVTAEDARGWTALHYACRTLAQVESSASITAKKDLDIIREGAEEVVQQLLRHGADLHSLDENALKPLDFRKYFGERRDDIMQAVHDTLQYKILAARQLLSSALSLPEKTIKRVAGAPDAWNGRTPAQVARGLIYQQSKQRYHAGRGTFSSARVQEAVSEEWIKGGHRVRAVRMLLLYLVYLAVFTLSAVLSFGRNMPHGYHLTKSVRSALENGSDLWDDDEAPFGLVDSAEKIWEWLQGPVLHLAYTNENNTWYEGDTLIDPGRWNAVSLVGTPRLSQWRTTSNSCEVWPRIIDNEVNDDTIDYCFADYCGEDPGGKALCNRASMDSASFGPGLKYKYVPDAHTNTIEGSFGIYGPGAFVEHIETNNRENAMSSLDDLEADGWIDEGTRAIALELALHSFSGRKLTYVLILIELPAEGGIPRTQPLYNTFGTFNTFNTLYDMLQDPRSIKSSWSTLGHDGGGVMGDRLTFLMELALIVLVLINIARERMELRRQGPYYFLMIANVFDIALIVGHGVIFYLHSQKSTALFDLDLGSNDQFIDIRRLADLVVAERQWVATMVIFVWVKLMDPLQAVFQDFFLLVKMIALMIGKLVKSFLPLLGIIYISWAFARYILLGELESLMMSISSALATQYPESLGEFTFEEIRAENLYQSWRYSITALFTVLVVVIMLNLLVSLLNDLYEELKGLAKADWCRAQATTIYMNDRWHAQQRLQMNKKMNHQISNEHEKHRWWCLDLPRLLGRGKAAVDSNCPPKDMHGKGGSAQARGLFGVKAKAAALGKDHLELASRAEEMQAAAVVASITDALASWDRRSFQAAKKGLLSPLPPIEVLRKLRRLMTDNKLNNMDNRYQLAQICWSLLRRKVLIHLAGVIGADGRGGGGGISGRAAPLRQSSSVQEPSRGLLRVVKGVVSPVSEVRRWLSTLRESSTPLGKERRQCWNEARKISIEVARSLVEFPVSRLASAESEAAGLQKQTAHNGQKQSHDGHQSDNDVEGQFGPAREVAELLSLLASLFRLGSPFSRLSPRALVGGGVSTAGGHRQRTPAFLTTPAAETFEVAASTKVVPPTTSEVKAALSAGDPTAGRRRRSSAITPIPTEQLSKQSFSHTPSRSTLGQLWDRLGRVRRGRAGAGGSNHKYWTADTPIRSTTQQGSEHPQGSSSSEVLTSTTRPRGGNNSLRATPTGGSPSASSPFPSENIGGELAPNTQRRIATAGPMESSSNPPRKLSSSAEATTEPRRASLDRSANGSNDDEIARLEHVRRQSPRNPARAGLRGLSPSSVPNDSATAVGAEPAKNDENPRPVSPFRHGPAHRRRGNGGGARLGGGSPKRELRATAVPADPRIPVEDYEMYAAGNFAVFLALRWVGSFRGSGESGFEMLVRLALREGRHSVLGAFSCWRPGTERWSRRGRPDNEQSQGTTGKDVKALLEGGTDSLARPPAVKIAGERRHSLSRTTFGAANVGRGLSPGKVMRVSSAFIDRRRSSVGSSGDPTDELSPRSVSMAKGAALAYLVAVGGAGADGAHCSSEGSQALVEAGMVIVLMKIAVAKSPSSLEQGPSARVLALASLAAIAKNCIIDDDTAAVRVRGLDDQLGSETPKNDAELWSWDGAEGSGGPVLLLSQALELAGLFMDIMVEGLASSVAPGIDGDEGEELADRSITGLELLLRACKSHDLEFNVATMDSKGASIGAHGTMVDAIRCHRGYPTLELMAEASEMPSRES
eukprot:g9583.t2